MPECAKTTGSVQFDIFSLQWVLLGAEGMRLGRGKVKEGWAGNVKGRRYGGESREDMAKELVLLPPG